MGQFASAHSALNMKLLVVLALAAIAAAEPEAEAKADPYLLYGGYGLGHYGYGLGYHGLGYGGYYYGKREAEASPRLRLSPTCMATATDLDTLAMLDLATMAMDLATTAATTAMDWPTTERGRLRPSPRLLLIPT